MFGDAAEYKNGPTLFATHSTHKLLAALSQASFIHIRDGRDPIEHARFNESFMMHASTSPFYPIIASNEISAAMMDGASGVALTTEAIREAVSFRQTIGRIKRQYEEDGDWFFGTWNASEVTDPGTKRARRVRRRARRPAGQRPELLGAAPRAKPGTASTASKTATACSTRSRSRSSRRASRPTDRSRNAASPPRSFRPTSCATASSTRRRRTSRSCSCSPSA